jgi:hypothetical protein
MSRKCPKCGGMARATWHARIAHGVCGTSEREARSMYSEAVESSSKEHMHYFCSCGFDWVGPTEDREP